MPPEGAPSNPFVGPVPFGRKDANLFFGRAGEIQELASLIVANRVVVLYAASGAGKTSLLNAGVLPLLEQRERFEVLPAARFSRIAADDEGVQRAENVYTYTALLNWSVPDDPAGMPHTTVAAYLADREAAHDARGRRLPRVVIFDQFEEIFTVHPEFWEQREGFFEQLSAALDEDRHLHVVLTLREDYLAQLEPLLPLLLAARAEDEEQGTVARSSVRYRLERLGHDAAIEAVTGPVEKAGRTFSPGVAEELVADLQKLRIDVGRADALETPGEFVEPVQLQVVCHSLWNDLPPAVEEITRSHIQTFGDVDEVLERFYDEAVDVAAKAAHVDEERLRRWLEEAFITSLGTRNTIYRAVESKSRFPDAAIDELEDRHLIRGDWRAGTRWYELTHDRFIAPIQSSNANAATAASRRRRKRLRRAVALLIPLVVLLAAWGAYTRNASADKLGLVTPSGELQLNTPYESSFGAAEPEVTRRLGNVISVRVATEGLRGDDLVVRATTVDQAGRPTGPREVSETVVTPGASREETTRELWVPHPRATGRFKYLLELEDETGTVLSDESSDFFRMKAGALGASHFAEEDGPVFALQVVKRGNGRVTSSPTSIDCGAICSSQFSGGTSVNLVAQPGPRTVFVRWDGACKVVRRACTVTMSQNRVVSATFALPPGSTSDIVEAGTPAGVSYRVSPRYGAYPPEPEPPAPEGSEVTVHCYTTGERRGRSTDWVLVKVNPDRYVPAAFLKHGKHGRPRGAKTC